MPGASRGWPAAVAAAAALAVGAFVPFPAQAPPAPVPAFQNAAPATAQREWQAVLESRARAVLDHDEAAFTASLDPAAPDDFQRRQRELFRSLAEVPLAEWGYEVRDAPAAGGTPEVVLRYALVGVDEVPTERPTGFTFTRRDGRWLLSGDERARGRSWRGPWDFGDCRVRVLPHGVIIGHDGSEELADRVAGELDSAEAAVTAVWGPDWRRQVGVLLPRSQEELRELVGAEFAVDGIAAVAVADKVDTASRRVEGPRVVLNTETADRLSDTSLRVVLRHEMAHVAARADTADGAPMWLLEGFADYVGYRASGLSPERIAPDLARRVRTGEPPAGPPPDTEFHASGRDLDLAYQQSWSLVAHLAKLVGEPKVVQLYKRIAGSGSPSEVDPALHEIAGLSTSDLLRSWRSELRRMF
ncbi:basic secretory protein-like protein [Saccharopolyspora sp. NPDC047091]|uniref:basic secretory protein-like protein n=1 Tax=Saccharopolyspora sp. NPDC047091 TaxID=3155924 RepID=UPI0033FEF217